MSWFTRFIERRKRARALRSIRESMAFFGYPVDDYDDDELEKAVVTFGRAVASTGVTAAEASDALKKISRLFTREDS